MIKAKGIIGLGVGELRGSLEPFQELTGHKTVGKP